MPQSPSGLAYPIRGRKFAHSIEVIEHICSTQTAFQRIDIYDTACFGKILTLDGHVQLSDLDEAAYHESLVHIPMLSIDGPRQALVVGGGDGGAVRELCRWSCLESIDMVEIDEGVIEACRKHLPLLSAGAFEDKRVKVHIGDAFEFVEKVREPYDFIVMDVTDVYEEEDESLSENLVSTKFLQDVARALTPAGLAVSQADNLLFCPYSMSGMLNSLHSAFSSVGSYYALVPSFGGFSGYCWAGTQAEVNPCWPGDKGLDLKYLSERTYRLGLGAVPFQSQGY